MDPHQLPCASVVQPLMVPQVMKLQGLPVRNLSKSHSPWRWMGAEDAVPSMRIPGPNLQNAMCEHANAFMHLMSTMCWQAAMFFTNVVGNAKLNHRWVQLLSLPAEGCKGDILHAVWPRLQ